MAEMFSAGLMAEEGEGTVCVTSLGFHTPVKWALVIVFMDEKTKVKSPVQNHIYG